MAERRQFSPLTKVVAVASIGLILSFGLCGVGYKNDFDWLSAVGVYIFIGSALVLLAALAVIFIRGIYSDD